MWTCLVWGERSTLDSFGVASHKFNCTTGEQNWITQTIYTDSEPPSPSLVPSAKLRSAHLPVFTSLVWRGRGSNPGLPHPERTLWPLCYAGAVWKGGGSNSGWLSGRPETCLRIFRKMTYWNETRAWYLTEYIKMHAWLCGKIYLLRPPEKQGEHKH